LAEVSPLQRPHLGEVDEVQPQLPVLDPLALEHAPREVDGLRLVDGDAAAICHLDRDHRYR
jgi:hypothetical protein